MKRRLFLGTILPIAAFAHASSFFDRDHDGQGKQKGKDHNDDHHNGDSRGPAKGHVRYFRPEDRVVLGQYYPVQSLPTGLRKKYARTGTLPPGWQKRVQPLPVAVIEHLPPPPPNCVRGYVDGYAVVYDRRTRVILDTVDLVGALTGR